MKLRSWATAIALLVFTTSAAITSADTYSTFQPTRYYSPNRQYFVVVTEKKTATLYQNGRRLRRVWRHTLPELPGTLMVANDGHRVIVIDRYYGNNHKPTLKAITTLDERGREIASYQLQEIANLERVLNTISASHWYSDARFSKDGRFLAVKTVVAKRQCSQNVKSAEEANACMESVPYEQLRFKLATGKLIERTSISLQ